ncbi:MAG: hypothetical protein ACTSPV_12390 [Candidatus Hodarchaeales archaeon]
MITEIRRITIEGRQTGKGAFTSVDYEKSHNISVRRFNISKTGNHWKECISFYSTDAYACVIDISNTGKHRCYKIYPDGHTENWSCQDCVMCK